MRKIRTNILNPISSDNTEFLRDHLISIEGSEIIDINPFDPRLHQDYEDRMEEILCPGFIDTHVHLSQYRIRGAYKPALLPWLQELVFPEEMQSRSEDVAAAIATEFYTALFSRGTTCSVIYTAPYPKACELAFELAKKLGVRAFIGMTMMDQNAPEGMLSTTDESLANSVSLFEKWEKKSELLRYIFTPRFAPTCSPELMTGTAKFALANDAWIQTHLSENTDEIAWVKELFNVSSYTEAYAKVGLLTHRTILAHAIHLSDTELDLIKTHGSVISHCPDSNFYLKSGEFPYRRIMEKGIPFAYGSDVGAGTTLSMPYHAKLANFRQSTDPILPEEAFFRITLGGAQVLALDDKIGSISPGKSADLVFLRPPDATPVDDDILSKLVFFGHEFEVRETIVNGSTRYSGR